MLTDPKKQILTLRQRIILSHVWSLAPEEVMCLDMYVKNYCNAGYLRNWISTEHSYKDKLFAQCKQWGIFYINTCFSNIEELPADQLILMSWRANKASDFYSVLILKDPKPNQLTDNTPQYLVGEGVQ